MGARGFGIDDQADARALERPPSSFRLQVESDEPFAGTIRAEGGTRATAFSGWVELMGAITRARRAGAEAPGRAGAARGR